MGLDEFSLDIDGSSRVLGLDIGDRRIGVAVSDSLGWTAQGVKVIDRKHADWLSEMDKLMESLHVKEIVVGLPRNMNGTIGPRGELCIKVAEELKERYSLPVHLWDERLSTAGAERTLITADVSRRKRKKVIDQMAATWILQGFLDAKRRQTHDGSHP
ncbi:MULTISPECIES: Holliday junction resolvase RuvX [Thermoactinomyces]|jgi:putative holliday junction resolvase|uniref:Putative pre-16S rRNA nuclease n=1 Tax=Thermoactinomyces daqus TaxID=1329516 RepID=A0A7W1XBB0_9BACL|nr:MULTISPECIES: Holliday junction resolvase RuvX [Thermoactinomyces]MBA4543484.1 Holliday junction resolvase RuvX [Thermoactinomyces daqus]MBH8597248.1 Holliday junction resolvase RuvX [Thermoactinomyces sp. CICC 10523]MBH8602809.1 Holliday junction resolvase RuvX [Thermoactinomyces sp. CICC 10522]MBH8606083.1 Holliday junction resolvase RuvX [Thermoactinomyces sp. CICC 10521]